MSPSMKGDFKQVVGGVVGAVHELVCVLLVVGARLHADGEKGSSVERLPPSVGAGVEEVVFGKFAGYRTRLGHLASCEIDGRPSGGQFQHGEQARVLGIVDDLEAFGEKTPGQEDESKDFGGVVSQFLGKDVQRNETGIVLVSCCARCGRKEPCYSLVALGGSGRGCRARCDGQGSYAGTLDHAVVIIVCASNGCWILYDTFVLKFTEKVLLSLRGVEGGVKGWWGWCTSDCRRRRSTGDTPVAAAAAAASATAAAAAAAASATAAAAAAASAAPAAAATAAAAVSS